VKISDQIDFIYNINSYNLQNLLQFLLSNLLSSQRPSSPTTTPSPLLLYPSPPPMSSNPATPTTEPLLPPNVERSFDTSVPPPPSSSKFLPSYLNLTNSVLGAGVLTLPYAFSLTGIYLGFLLLVLFSLLSALSLHYLDASLTSASTTIPSSKSSSPPPTTYASLAHYFCGSRVSLLTTTSSLLYSYGSSVSYLLITLNLLVDLTSYSRLGWSVAIGLPMLPLTNMVRQ